MFLSCQIQGPLGYHGFMKELSHRKLDIREVAESRTKVPLWEAEGDKLNRKFDFAAYKDGLVFASAVGHLADRLDHHPEITIGYRTVTVSVNTHSVGGLSAFDFELARQIDLIA